MKNKTTNFERLTVTIPEYLLEKFRRYCEDNAINMSAKIAKLIEKEIQ